MTTKRSHFIHTVSTAILLGITCNFIWLYEIQVIKGWYSLNWLDEYMYSVFLIIPITVSSFVLPFRFSIHLNMKKLIFSIFGISVVSLISFETAREFLFMMYSRFFGFGDYKFIILLKIIVGILTPGIIFSLGGYFLTNRFILRIPKKVIFIFLFSIFLSIVFGLLTVKIFTGYGHGTSFVDSVKMGYPIFWLNIFLGLSSFIILKIKIITNKQKKSDSLCL